MKRVLPSFERWRKGAGRVARGVTLAALLLGAGLASLGCGSGAFDSPSQVKSLRVLAVHKDHPYPNPGTDVAIDLLWTNANPTHDAAAPNVDVRWIAGCFNPLGDLYYSCYSQFGVAGGGGGLAADAGVDPSKLLGLLPKGDRYTLSIPPDVISRRPPPADPSLVPYGLAVVFFVLCQGHLDIAAPGAAFPLDCYDDDHKPVGPDKFVPGYTSIYVYDAPATTTELQAHPERYPTNANPIMTALDIESATIIDDLDAGGGGAVDGGTGGNGGTAGDGGVAGNGGVAGDGGVATGAGSTTGDAGAGTGDAGVATGDAGAGSTPGGAGAAGATGALLAVDRCTAENRDDCPVHRLTPHIDESSAEVDVLNKGHESTFLREELWIDYYSTSGDISKGVRLVNDATSGWNADQWGEWKAPPTAGPVTIWGVVHDNRGGVAWVERHLIVR